MEPSGNQARKVSHVNHEQRSDLIGDCSKALEVQPTWVGRPTGNDELGLVLAREFGCRLHINAVRRFVDAVRDDAIKLARKIEPHPVGEMPAVREIEAEDRIAR